MNIRQLMSAVGGKASIVRKGVAYLNNFPERLKPRGAHILMRAAMNAQKIRALSMGVAVLLSALVLAGCNDLPFSEPKTPEPTAPPTLPHPTTPDAQCGFGAFEPSGHQYWAAVLKLVDAETLVLTNVKRSNSSSPDTDDMNPEQYIVKLWGVTVPDDKTEDAARLQRQLVPPGSWVKVIVIGEELEHEGTVETSVANHHNWSLNLDLLRAGYAHLQDGVENECLVEAYWTGRPESERPRTPEPTPDEDAREGEEPYIDITLSPGHAVEFGTPIAVAVRFANLPKVREGDNVFQIHTLTNDACNGDGAGQIRQMEWVDAAVVERTAYISANCPAGEHILAVMLGLGATGEVIQHEVAFIVNAPPGPTATLEPTVPPTPTPEPSPTPPPPLSEYGSTPGSAGSADEGEAVVLAACYVAHPHETNTKHLLFTDEHRNLSGGPFLVLKAEGAEGLMDGTCYQFAAQRKGWLDWRMCGDHPYGGCGLESEQFLWHRDIPQFVQNGGVFRHLRQAW